jgi:hypothetical protein
MYFRHSNYFCCVVIYMMDFTENLEGIKEVLRKGLSKG